MPSADKSISESILSVLSGANANDGIKVKKLRKMVLLSLQQDETDKDSKKAFKKAVQKLEEDKKLKLNEDGLVFLKKHKKDKKNKTKRSAEEIDGPTSKKTKSDADDTAVKDESVDIPGSSSKTKGEVDTTDLKGKNAPCKGNPSGVTRLFVGNLPFAVDEAGMKDFLPGITHIKWITDQTTGQFYGSSFIEMENSVSAAAAVAKSGQELMGRPIKINYAPARPGDVWPPQKVGQTGGGQAGGKGIKALGEKPAGCLKLFIGNLSYEIDDEGITKFFSTVDAEVKAVRWLHHRESGDFKGCGYVEFWNTEACEKAATLNGKTLLGRPIRIDWSD